MENKDHTVAVLGASNKPDRFSNRAVRLLKRHGYHVIPVHPRLSEIEDLPVAASIGEISDKIDTLTVYVSPERILPMIGDVIKLKPGRIILNPGTESGELMDQLDAHQIPCLRACTLVLLNSGQF